MAVYRFGSQIGANFLMEIPSDTYSKDLSVTQPFVHPQNHKGAGITVNVSVGGTIIDVVNNPA